METLLRVAGASQLLLALASLAIPRVLGWQADTQQLRPLTRQVFWTYAAYVWAFNLSFGLLSAAAPDWLLTGAPLAAAVNGFIAAYWGARLVLQFTYFDRAEIGRRASSRLAEVALVGLFAGLSVLYAVVGVFGGW